ncbi:TonB-dependent siderophore receptor [Chryseobacterium sp. FH2]|uniref:TonB-dependent siderophore receptor n=1 Tax=Chryseobacterium sp. FH2 TaxID=1674291 RepID=UPI00069FF235|nr:TonB-dependent siderophore receptor [Chryseobacterium sp. FH2]
MKNVLICISMLGSMLAYAQEKDTVKSANIEEVVVNGKYYKKYVEKEGSSSLRLNEELIKIPQNISIITNRALEDQQVTTISDGLLRNVAGAQRLEHWGEMYSRINMRGSRAGAFFNGVNVTSNWGPLSEDMSYVDHIEFVKGPGGFLMSAGEPSGIYNIVTKKPTGNPFNGSARVTLGSFDMYRAETDLDTRVSKKVSIRLNLMGSQKNSFRDYEFNDRYVINPSIKLELTDKTTLVAEYIYQKAKMSEVGSAYVFSTEGYATRPVNYTHTDPGIMPSNIEDHTVNVNLQHQFNKNWKLTTQVTYLNDYTNASDIWPDAVNADGTMIRRLSYWEGSNVMRFGQIYLNGYEKTGKVSHRILAGLDLGSKKYLADWGYSHVLDSTPFNTNILTYQPVTNGYGYEGWIERINGTPLNQRATPGGTIEQNYSGVYLQDELGFLEDKLRLTVAARYTNIKQNNYGDTFKADKLSPRIGLSYSIDDNTSAYALFDQSFTPQSGLFRDGSTAKPLTGNNYEIGIKRDWFNGKWNTTLSIYNIRKDNAISGDPTDPSGKFSILDGKTGVQGVEFDLKGEIVKGFNAIFNYAYTDNEYKQTIFYNDPITNETETLHKEGDKVAGYAKHTVNGWLNYTFTNGILEGFGLSFGGTYLADRTSWTWDSTGTTKPMNDYLKFDTGASWENSKIRVNLNIFNVFNRYLYSGANYGTYYYYQAEAPRNWRFSVAYKF